MPIEESDRFAWYNDEINRYRDHEWQLASISVAVSTAIVLFAKNPDTQDMLSPCILASLVIFSVVLSLAAECHTHWKLNDFRLRRDSLLHEPIDNKQSSKTDTKVRFLLGWIDVLYWLGFTLIPALVGTGAVLILMGKIS